MKSAPLIRQINELVHRSIERHQFDIDQFLRVPALRELSIVMSAAKKDCTSTDKTNNDCIGFGVVYD